MDRVALEIGSIKIYWYSITMFLGVLLGFIVAYIEIKRKKINKDNFENMAFYTVICGFLGARLYYVIFNLDYYLNNLSEIFMVWRGGLAIHGGIIGACLAIYFCTKKYKMSYLEVLDICAPALLIGQVIGRWGNFFNGEAHGGIVSRVFLERIHIPQFIIEGMNIGGLYYHPTFLYESVLNLICFIVLMVLRHNKKINLGAISGIYLIWYSVVRFFVESLRTDSLMLGPLKMAQVIGIPLFIVGIVLVVTSRKRDKYNKEVV